MRHVGHREFAGLWRTTLVALTASVAITAHGSAQGSCSGRSAVRTSTAAGTGRGTPVIIGERDRLHETARAIAGRILRQGPIATRLAKLALNAAARVDLDSGLLIESLAQTICYQSPDRAEGTAAFLEKRRPNFTR